MSARATTTSHFGLPRRLTLWMDIVLAAAAVVAVAALILEYGFRAPPISPAVLHVVEAAVVAVFVLDRIGRMVLARQRKAYFLENWIDFALMLLAAVVAGVGPQVLGQVLGAGALYVLIWQGYILVALLLRGVGMNLRMAGSGIAPTWLLIGSFLFLCFAGSGLLMLPVASPPDAAELYYVDALFTATSATCVTGLVTKRTGMDFTPFGQAVILALIQLGGLGIMLFGTFLAMLVGKGLGLRSAGAMGEMLGTGSAGQIPRMLKFVVLVTLALEIVGAALLYPMFLGAPGPDGAAMGPGRAVWCSVFHSVSSFCNAGFSLFDRNMMEGVAARWSNPLRGRWQILGVMAPLIVVGGLGFPVLLDAGRYVRGLLRGALRRWGPASAGPVGMRPRLSLHSRIVLTSTVLLLTFGAVVLLLVEPAPGPRTERIGRGQSFADSETVRRDWPEMAPPQRLREAVFHSVSARTAGFNTIDVRELSDAGKLWLCGLMTVGGSPAGTAGGMKTVTVVLLGFLTWSVLRRRDEVEVSRRSIAPQVLRRAAAAAILYLALVGGVTMLLSISMRDERFIDVLFEACSACGTVGLSAGLTGAGHYEMTRVVTIAAMFAGRLGLMTLLLALTAGLRRARYAYPQEDVLIG